MKELKDISSENMKLAWFRDLFLFVFYCNGINVADLILLKYKDIEKDEICFIRRKTRRTSKRLVHIRVFITSEMCAIIQRWGNPVARDRIGRELSGNCPRHILFVKDVDILSGDNPLHIALPNTHRTIGHSKDSPTFTFRHPKHPMFFHHLTAGSTSRNRLSTVKHHCSIIPDGINSYVLNHQHHSLVPGSRPVHNIFIPNLFLINVTLASAQHFCIATYNPHLSVKREELPAASPTAPIPQAPLLHTGTLKDYRGKGLASQIFGFALPHLRQQGIRQYLLEVLQHNTKAVSVYRNLGFEVSCESYYFTQNNEEIRNEMKRNLKNAISYKQATVGITIETDEYEILTQKRSTRFPLMSVFKFHIALAVLDKLDRNVTSLDSLDYRKVGIRA